MLVNHLHPNRAKRIDGTGGDDGRDVQVRLDDGLHAKEIKSFTRRLTASERRQIKESLSRASALDVEFPISWRGRTCLDTQLARRPFIQRYYLGDAYQGGSAAARARTRRGGRPSSRGV